MDIIIESPGIQTGQSLEQHITEKLAKLHPSDHIIRANVTLFSGPERSTPNAYCEIRLEIPGNDLFVKSAGNDFYEASDAAIATLQEQLRRAKEKMIDSQRRGL